MNDLKDFSPKATKIKKRKIMKKDYKKPEMQVYDVKMTQFLCTSEPNGYPGPFGYIPSQHEDDEMLRA